MRNGLLVLAAALVGSGCFSPSFKDGAYTCGPLGECPSGQKCQADNVCRAPGANGGIDGGGMGPHDGATGGDSLLPIDLPHFPDGIVPPIDLPMLPDLPSSAVDLPAGPDLPVDVDPTTMGNDGPGAPDAVTPPPDMAMRICTPVSSDIYVDANVGDDHLNNGSIGCPFRSITAGLALASMLGGNGISIVVHVAPGTYDAGHGEVFPLAPTANVTVEGTQDSTVVNGGAPLGDGSSAIFHVTTSGVTLRGMTLTNADPDNFGLAVRTQDASAVTLDQLTVTGCSDDGIQLSGASVVTGTALTSTANDGAGISALDDSKLVLSGSTVSLNGQSGLYADSSAGVTTMKLTSDQNNQQQADSNAGVIILDAATWNSTSDTITNNFRHGVQIGANVQSTATASIDQAQIIGSSLAGISVHCNSGVGIRPCLVLRRTLIGKNGSYGVLSHGATNLDLGSSLVQGQNSLQPGGQRNVGVGLCVFDSGNVTAIGNHWSSCPPEPGGSCDTPTDFANAGTATIDTSSCFSP